MSLINDALKRARQAQTKQSPPPLASAPLHPATANRRSTWLALLLPVALVAGAAAVVLLFWKWNFAERTPVQTVAERETAILSQPSTLLTKADAEPVAAVELARAPSPNTEAPAPLAQVLPLTEAHDTVAASSHAAFNTSGAATPNSDSNSAEASSQGVAIATELPPAGLAFRLQGILYRPANPSAVINGKVVSAGDYIGEARVQAITQRSATLFVDNQAIVLTLP